MSREPVSRGSSVTLVAVGLGAARADDRRMRRPLWKAAQDGLVRVERSRPKGYSRSELDIVTSRTRPCGSTERLVFGRSRAESNRSRSGC